MLSRWPFLIPFLFMTAGMTFSAINGHFCGVTTVMAVFLCLLLSSFIKTPWLFSVCAAIFFFFFGLFALTPWLNSTSSSSGILNYDSGRSVTIEGVVAERPSVASDGSRIVIRVERVITGKREDIVTGKILLYVSEGGISLLRGDRIRFVSRVSVPRRLGVPGEFDFSSYLAFQGITATGRVSSQNEIVMIRAAAVESWQRNIDRLAGYFGDVVRRSITDERVSSILTALLLGDQRRIPQELADVYTRAGVNHILSISGFHIGIIAAFITLLVVWFLTRFEYSALHWDVRKIAIIIAVPAMLVYLFLTGNAPATARSVIMLTVFAIALFAERERNSLNTLLFAAFFLVAINPPTLFDISFQLSFLSLWGILLAAPMIARCTSTFGSYWVRSLIQFIAASVAASLVTLVPVLYIFKVASFNGILTNFIIVPLLGYGAALAGFISLPLIMLFPASAGLLLWPAETLIIIANHCIVWCSTLPVITFYGINSRDMFFFLIFMVCVTFIRKKILLIIVAVVIPITAVANHVYSATASDGCMHITMLSVGQAESILIRFPDDSTMLVDGGGYLYDNGHDFGQRVLAPALGALHVRCIDRMIATHDHPDHSGGLPFIIKNFSVGEFWSGQGVSDDILTELSAHAVPRRTLAVGDVIALPCSVTLKVLSTGTSSHGGSEQNANEGSLVFRLSYGSFSMLFCADAGFEAEQRMLVRQQELASTVLKVGHHGSRYSTSEVFLDKVKPKLALISAGAGNRFGLPSARTVGMLKTKKIPTYRTDRDGTIELVTNGMTWSVLTPYKPE